MPKYPGAVKALTKCFRWILVLQKYIVSKTQDRADDHHEKKYPDKCIASPDGKPRSQQRAGEIANCHGDGIVVKDMAASTEENDGTNISGKVYKFGVCTCF